MNLIIVESPTKARTIQKFLTKDYSVVSSYGHIRDLPKRELGIDVEKNFEPKYVVPLTARKKITPIKKSLEKVQKVILATDEDREGEAISWHLAEVLKLNPAATDRIAFHEITKPAIEEALKNPRRIDMDLVDAQQARRILDRLVGYKLSPFLWKKVAKGLSAGRVQSVAVRIIVEREREIQNFKPEEYWNIEALLKKQSPSSVIASESRNRDERGDPAGLLQSSDDRLLRDDTFKAVLIKKGDNPIAKFDISTKENADKILKDLEGANYQIANIEKKETKRNPLPPFTTSTLQQAAGQKLHFSAKMTMSLAQNLYENGLITYHRTDSLNLSQQALGAAQKFITQNFGQNYWAGFQRHFKTKSKGAQEAHEAIRPTDPSIKPDEIKIKLKYGEKSEDASNKLYGLIWRRFIASQMSQAVFDSTTINIDATPPFNKGGLGGIFLFRANGQMLKHDGFLRVYPIKFEETDLPPLEEKEFLDLVKLAAIQHFTQPPPRYSEATLIKELEKHGIGRPSTYAPTISTIQERNYIQKDEQKKLLPTDIGFTVNDMLVEHFPEIVDIKFTAYIEEELDEIAQGHKQWRPVIKEFYDPFAKHLAQKYEEVAKQRPEPEITDRLCPKCGKPLLIRTSRFGKFYACSGFPECRHIEPIAKKTGVKCPVCGQGDIIERRSRRGKIFYGCSSYPACNFALWDKPTGDKCPKCSALLVTNVKNDKIKCSNKDCGYVQPSQEKG